MSDLQGTIVSSMVVPGSTEDKYATHTEQYGAGGYRTVASINDRNNIPKERRVLGMLVNVQGDKIYKLKNNPTTATTQTTDWEVLETGSPTKGPQGPQGFQGPQGNPGAASTVKGPQGPQGPQGNPGVGSKGNQGPQGPKGDPGVGSKGNQGPQGPKGDPSTVKGTQGPQGPKGDPSTVKGPQGPQGPQGNPGAASTVKGPQGDKGPQGPQGPNGDAYWSRSGTELSPAHSGDTVHASGFYQESLRKYKKDIKEFDTSAIEILSKVQVVSFKYKNDERGATHIGIIADNSPAEITGIDHDNFDVPSTTGLLIKAIQELKSEIDEIKNSLG